MLIGRLIVVAVVAAVVLLLLLLLETTHDAGTSKRQLTTGSGPQPATNEI